MLWNFTKYIFQNAKYIKCANLNLCILLREFYKNYKYLIFNLQIVKKNIHINATILNDNSNYKKDQLEFKKYRYYLKFHSY